MKDLAAQAFAAVTGRDVSYADVRVIEIKERELGTKNGKVAQLSSSESLGLGVRVIAGGCWGFAATDDLTRSGMKARRNWLCESPARELLRDTAKSCWR